MEHNAHYVRVTWETDGESPDLPEEVEIPDHVEEEGISDFLSDEYGWLVYGWEFREDRCDYCPGPPHKMSCQAGCKN